MISTDWFHWDTSSLYSQCVLIEFVLKYMVLVAMNSLSMISEDVHGFSNYIVMTWTGLTMTFNSPRNGLSIIFLWCPVGSPWFPFVFLWCPFGFPRDSFGSFCIPIVCIPDGSKMASSWPQDGPRWPQDGPGMAPRWLQDGPKTAQDAQKWP